MILRALVLSVANMAKSLKQRANEHSMIYFAKLKNFFFLDENFVVSVLPIH
jgi:hypothetical protein